MQQGFQKAIWLLGILSSGLLSLVFCLPASAQICGLEVEDLSNYKFK